ncbi:efflux RND transporter periplasmic adaptor subunit [Thalassomonas actiniarum]|uniref:Efflux RND transporter periplasmic adaptor subunit n=1 Tax=Thalassomonas actiniarum TaxID=485447 RepID=A0AAF0C5X3_9GAMM|nr:efflux RND transporter periplasmic adaptor subunit [Thalassomonas actiniarum]WDE01591.1 efflux RND transporter periplasmic adaptor subunit [Thalassomonas actiniarum]
MKPFSSCLLIFLSLGTLVTAFPEKSHGAAFSGSSREHSAPHGDEHADEHGDEHGNGHKDEHGDEHGGQEGLVEITPLLAQKAGIKTMPAGSGEIKQTVTVYGKAVAEPSRVSQVKARFSGVITELKVNVGDKVEAGDVLAQVESNSSLTRYSVTAPTSGIVVTRNANPGELADGQVLLTLADYSRLWVEYQIFPGQAQAVISGQAVTVSSGFEQAESAIKHLLPGQSNQDFLIARVPLDNRKGIWSPGLLLSGSIVLSQIEVPLVVANRALQEVEGQQVVFVRTEKGFQTRTLVLGQSDGISSQVLSGLNAGEHYVVENSYLLKADLEKSSAEHHH